MMIKKGDYLQKKTDNNISRQMHWIKLVFLYMLTVFVVAYMCVCVTPVKWRYTRCTLLIYINFLYDLFFFLFFFLYIILYYYYYIYCCSLPLLILYLEFYFIFCLFWLFFYTFLITIISFYFKTLLQLPMQIYFRSLYFYALVATKMIYFSHLHICNICLFSINTQKSW